MEKLYSIATVWVIIWRSVWPVIIVLGLIAASASFPPWRRYFPQPWLFLAMFILPLIGIVWAGGFWASEQSMPVSDNHWRSNLHNILSVLSVVIAFGLAFWFRKVRRAWLVFVCAIFVVLFTLAAWLVGAMAITNVWL